jgi:hypothetical protein
MRWAGHVAILEEMSNAYNIFVENREGNRPLGRYRRIWKDNIKMDVREVWWEGVNWMYLAPDRDQ